MYALSARYTGSAAFHPSTSDTVALTVSKATPTFTLRSSSNPVWSGTSVYFTAVVTAVPPGSGTPTGTVQFRVDGAPLGAPMSMTQGTALSISTNQLSGGVHGVTAAYSGDDQFVAGTSAAYQQVVRSRSATIVSILDVAHDQGHQVRVTFSASDLDVAGSATPIVRYDVFRRIDAVAAARMMRPRRATARRRRSL